MRGFQVALEEHKMRPLFSVQLLVSFFATLNTQSNKSLRIGQPSILPLVFGFCIHSLIEECFIFYFIVSVDSQQR